MKQDRRTKRVNVNTFDSWADFTLKGFVGKKPDEYRHRDDGWDNEESSEKNDALEKKRKMN